MAEEGGFSIPEEYQQYVFQALELGKAGAIATGHGIVSTLQWSVVLFIGFAVGLAVYGALLGGAGVALQKVLKSRKLYNDSSLPKPKSLKPVRSRRIPTVGSSVITDGKQAAEVRKAVMPPGGVTWQPSPAPLSVANAVAPPEAVGTTLMAAGASVGESKAA